MASRFSTRYAHIDQGGWQMYYGSKLSCRAMVQILDYLEDVINDMILAALNSFLPY
jgi:hypothetical protein